MATLVLLTPSAVVCGADYNIGLLHILFCIEFSSKAMRIVENVVMTFLTLISLCYIIHFRQPVGIITLISSATLIIKNNLCGRKKQHDRFVTKLISLITLVRMDGREYQI